MASSQWYEDPDSVLTELRRDRLDRGAAPTIRGYDEIREISRGGQGVIYSAVQRSTRRRVAIKILLEGIYASASARRRFEREVDVVAGLRHSHIVGVYDSGLTDDDRLYLVMEFVEGVPVDEYSRGRPLREILGLFATTCEAVQFAHQRGVIHRDIKPSNICVDSDGHPRVLDFGLAKASGDEEGSDKTPTLTKSGQFMGSVPWMSPEQAEGRLDQVDVRTDVYALGVLLYQLITGVFPYAVTGSLRDVLTKIASAAPARPIAFSGEKGLARSVEPDLETIVLRCLAKSPEERYQSAGELSRDVRHYLAGEPIEARRDSIVYVLRKNLKRHRLTATVAAMIVVLTVAYAATMSFLYRKTQSALAAEHEARRVAQEQSDRAIATRRFLEDMLESVNPSVAQGKDVTVLRGVLDDASRRVRIELGKEPEVQASIENTIGQTYGALGLFDESQEHLTAALETRRRLLGEEHPDTLESMLNLGTLRMSQRRLSESETSMRSAYEGRAKVLGPEHVDTLSALSGLAMVIANQGRLDEAEPLQRAALDGLRRIAPEDSLKRLSALNNMASLLQRRGKLDEAEPLYREAVERCKRVLGVRHPETLLSVNNLASLLQARGLHVQAEQSLRDALEISRSVWGPEHPDTLLCLNNLGHSLQTLGKLEEAESLFRDLCDARTRVLGSTHADTLVSLNNLATVLQDRGKLDDAEEMLRKILEIRQREMGETHPDVAVSLNNLAHLLQARGKMEEAEPLLRESMELNRRAFGDENPNTLRAMNNLAVLLQSIDRLSEAEPLIRESYAIKVRVLGPDHIDTIITLHNLAHLLRKQGRQQQAEPLFRQCLRTLEQKPLEDPRIIPMFKSSFGQCLLEMGKFDEAEKVLLESHAAFSERLAPDPERIKSVVLRLVSLYEQWNKPESAAHWRELITPPAVAAPEPASATP